MKPKITVIWDRNKWFEYPPPNPYLYYFLKDKDRVEWGDIEGLPSKFLKIPSTAIYEYGGTLQEAKLDLTNFGIENIIIA
jgi:hypothetical protein